MRRSGGALKTEGFLWILAARITNKRRGRRLRGAKQLVKVESFQDVAGVCEAGRRGRFREGGQ